MLVLNSVNKYLGLDGLSKYGVLVLAGGNSSRMKFPKPWLDLGNGLTFLEHIVHSYCKFGFVKIVVVLNNEFISGQWHSTSAKVKQHAMLIANNNIEKGRLHSVKLGVQQMLDLDYLIIHNVDNPHVNKEIIQALVSNANPNGTTTPEFEGRGGHPILISKEIINKLAHLHNNSTLHDVLSAFNRKRIEVHSACVLTNVNSQADYIEVLSEFT